MIFSRFVLFILLSLFIFNSCSSDNDTAPIENSVPADNSDSGDDSDPTDTSEIILTNATVQEITDISATLISSYSTSSELPVQSIGFCWSTNPSPTIDDNTIEVSIDDTNFSATISNLQPSTTYYVRTFATNSSGIYYSNDGSFETDPSTEGVFEGDLILSNQNDVDAFFDMGYEIVTGDLTIETTSTPIISDLTPLEKLTVVGGRLYISNNANLVDLSGLEQLIEVGSFVVFDNHDLTGISSLSQLNTIGDDLRIIGTAIESLNGLENVTNVPGAFVVKDTQITTLQGIENLTEVGELYIVANSQLQHIDALSSLNSIYNLIQIYDNPSLENLAGLNNLTVLDLTDPSGDGPGYIIISLNPSLTDLQGLENLTEFNGVLTIRDNYSLNSIKQLASLTRLKDFLYINNNTKLEDFCVLTPLFLSGNGPDVFSTVGNAYNPTKQDIIDGNCSF
ncbi:MAG: hypothetical protein CMC35_00190 [Flavobacteriaceae bacterium]|nr:hypothetical protein [Flavobacteriaceae bacterium]|tara:strand:+ start:9135 stop:10490 length:1356 start_codon:yes stop_codon:yes gene_type:complete